MGILLDVLGTGIGTTLALFKDLLILARVREPGVDKTWRVCHISPRRLRMADESEKAIMSYEGSGSRKSNEQGPTLKIVCPQYRPECLSKP